MRIAAVIVAGGSGNRFGGDLPKQFQLLDGKAVLQRTIEAFQTHQRITDIIVVIGAQDHEHYKAFIHEHQKLLPPVIGGSTRQASVFAGLKALESLAPDLVLVHDAARPFVSLELIDRVLGQLLTVDGCIPALPVTETVKKITANQQIETTIPRDQLCLAQTPQGFKYRTLLKVHEKLQGYSHFTDDASLFEALGLTVTVCPGDTFNVKITYPEDLKNVHNYC